MYEISRIHVVSITVRSGTPCFLVKNILRINPLLNVALLFRDGYDYDGYKLRVEFPRGGGGSFRGSRDGGGRSSRFGGGSSRGNPARRSQHRVKVTGIIYTGK